MGGRVSRTLCPTGAWGEVGCPRGAVCGAAEGSAVRGAQARSCHRSLDVVLWRLHRPPSFSSDSQAWSSWTGWGLQHLWPPPPRPRDTRAHVARGQQQGELSGCARRGGPGRPGAEALGPCCPSLARGPGLGLTLRSSALTEGAAGGRASRAAVLPRSLGPGVFCVVGARHARGGLPQPHHAWACHVKGVAGCPVSWPLFSSRKTRQTPEVSRYYAVGGLASLSSGRQRVCSVSSL